MDIFRELRVVQKHHYAIITLYLRKVMIYWRQKIKLRINQKTSGHNVWKSIIYKESHDWNPINKKSWLFDQKGVLPVPLNLLPGLNLGKLLLKLTGVGDSYGSLRTCSNKISAPFPPPFSKLSLKRGRWYWSIKLLSPLEF